VAGPTTGEGPRDGGRAGERPPGGSGLPVNGCSGPGTPAGLRATATCWMGASAGFGAVLAIWWRARGVESGGSDRPGRSNRVPGAP